MSAGRYLELARRLTDEILARGKLPIFCGGTGFYLRILREGISPLPIAPPGLRRALKSRLAGDGAAAHRWLRLLDPARAAEIAPGDVDRSIRAIEVAFLTGRRMSETMREPRAGALSVRWLVLGCRRERRNLYARIDRRVDLMLSRGLLEEAARNLGSGVPVDAPGLSAIGYAEAVRVLRQEMPESELAAAISLRTRHYAKRQETWFRKEPGIAWLPEGDADRLPAALRLLASASAPPEA